MMIESPHFKTKHMIHWESQEPDFLFVDDQYDDDRLDYEGIVVSILIFDSLEAIVNHDQDLLPEPKCALEVSCDDLSRSFDGLVCIYDFRSYILVTNPSIRWLREVPQAKLQTLVFYGCDEYEPNLLGFGKDICTGTYKLVWLYNLFEVNLEGATTCEVFDFNTNTWRYVESSPYRVLYDQNPLFVDGSLHWFCHSNAGIKILSFDCHTEIFQVISQSPITQEDKTRIVMCKLDNRLCVSEKKWPTQDIWNTKQFKHDMGEDVFIRSIFLS
ncbi:F-box/LRR-repeat/kelch-repeat protein [Cardamine amara subsp. amara]|uniref:F-box/LRR-repeat/kelch-repeat protein n=1 Tax=Cardamine amara subsp. amara TaxID=228776 RepID=A0ABD1ADR8_CARAN